MTLADAAPYCKIKVYPCGPACWSRAQCGTTWTVNCGIPSVKWVPRLTAVLYSSVVVGVDERFSSLYLLQSQYSTWGICIVCIIEHYCNLHIRNYARVCGCKNCCSKCPSVPLPLFCLTNDSLTGNCHLCETMDHTSKNANSPRAL